MTNSTQNQRRITITIEGELLDEFKKLAAVNHRTMTQELRHLILQAVNTSAEPGNNAAKQVSHTKPADKSEPYKLYTNTAERAEVICEQVPLWVAEGLQRFETVRTGQTTLDAFEAHGIKMDIFKEQTNSDFEREPELWDAFLAEWQRQCG